MCLFCEFILSSRRRHTRCALVTGVQTCALPIWLVTPPRVKASPIHLECRYLQTVDLPADTPGVRNAVVFGQVIGIHIDESVLTAGLVDMAKLKPIARLGYMDYCLEIGRAHV